jgi:hypothetical protein
LIWKSFKKVSMRRKERKKEGKSEDRGLLEDKTCGLLFPFSGLLVFFASFYHGTFPGANPGIYTMWCRDWRDMTYRAAQDINLDFPFR